MNKYIELFRPRHLIGCSIIFLIGTVLFWKVNGYINNVALGLAAFLLTYSSVYVFNDLMDLEKDKKHYVKWKRERPLPKGSIKPSTAKKAIIINLVFGLILSSLINPTILLLNSMLFIINFIYSYFQLKEKAVVSIILINSLQLIKILNGWLISELTINGLPITMPLMYAVGYGLVITFYKGKWFKNKNKKKALVITQTIILISLIIVTLIFYPILRQPILYVVILLVIGSFILKKFTKDVSNEFSVKKSVLFNLLFLLCLFI